MRCWIPLLKFANSYTFSFDGFFIFIPKGPHMMIVRIFCLVVAFVNFYSSYADIGYQYCMKTTITLANGVRYNGYLNYYDIGIVRDEKGFFYSRYGKMMRLRSEVRADNEMDIVETDYHFHTYVHGLLSDTIEFYSNLLLIYPPENIDQGQPPVPIFPVAPSKIYYGDIADLVVHRVHFCAGGMHVSTRCTTSDNSWLKDKITGIENIGGVEICNFEAYLFGNNSEEVKQLLQLLKQLYEKQQELTVTAGHSQEDFNAIQLQIDQQIESLRQQKVIVVSFCSC